MAALINFESSWKKSEERENTARRREDVLTKAKKKYEEEEQRKAEAKARGEDTWMLSSVSERVEQEEKELKKAKAKKKKKKVKKDKKKKKTKKRSRSSSSGDSDSEPAWVEKSASNTEKTPVIKGPKLERDNWMVSPLDFGGFGGPSRTELRAKKQAEEEEKKRQQTMMDMPGQHKNELNPYWKGGGSGMPELKPDTKKETKPVAGDGGVGWLRKALQRCEDQAKEDGRNVEDVAAERYGSLKQLKARLREAEESVCAERLGNRENQRSGMGKDRHNVKSLGPARPFNKDSSRSGSHERDRQRNRSRDRDNYRGQKRKFLRPGESEESSRGWKSRSRSRDRSRHNDRSKSRSRSSDRTYTQNIDRSRSHVRSRNDQRSRSKDRKNYKDSSSSSTSSDSDRSSSRSKNRSKTNSRNRSRSRSQEKSYRKCRDRSRSRSRDRRSCYFRAREERRSSRDRDVGDNRNSGDRGQGSRIKALAGRFRKPGDANDNADSGSSRSRNYPTSQPAWKKKAFVKPEESSVNDSDILERKLEKLESSNREDCRKPERSSVSRKVKDEPGTSKRRQVSESSSTSSDSDSSSLSDSAGEEEKKPVATPQKLLTEQEMNQLGAKLVRAEIMGNEALATKIKVQLEQAREASKAAPQQPAIKGQSEGHPGNEDEKVVVLTRTDKRGNVRPLADRKLPQEPRRGRKKKQKVETHVGDKGERLRYFQDDDKLNLKEMVEQEKLGTAEDANMMFARLAGRSTEKTNDDYQVDDMFISRASHKEADSRQEDRDRSSAIFEHKKMSEAMEKCQHCFDKVPKHLIIAIGIKCYLCLPNHKSLAEGHCFIVPMQHVTQGTVLDEDIWDEIQVFRKGLAQMFESQDEDCVFMEMSRNLRHHPHMVLECVPLPREVGDLSPIYFKKAIQDCETEWSQNQKLVDLKDRDVRKAIPKGFPYFSVDFGLQSGFAHVIEDEKEFPPYFGREIVGGMLDVGPELWRKPHKENFDDQRKKVLKFAECWKPFDWTNKLKSQDEDS